MIGGTPTGNDMRISSVLKMKGHKSTIKIKKGMIGNFHAWNTKSQ